MKKIFKKACAVALAAALSITALAAAPEAEAAKKAKKVKKITLSASKKTLAPGGKFTLKVKKVKPAKASKKVTWKSNKTSVATVSKKGVVKAKKAGTAKITAVSKKNKKVKATCKVKVKVAETPETTAPVQTAAVSPTPAATSKAPASTSTVVPSINPTPTPWPTPDPGGPDSLKGNADFNMGTVINYAKTQDEKFTELAKKQFDIVSFENEMKGYSLLDTKASQDGDGTPVCKFDQADEMVEWAISNGLRVRGHVLIWENSMASSFFYKGYDNTGKEEDLVDKDTLLMRMKSYENQVISHFEEKYPGVVIAWDVINEAIDNSAKEDEKDPTTGLHLYTTGNFYKILGGEYIKYAFQYANDAVKAATEKTGNEILLYYNDFNCFQSPKTEYILELIDYLNADPNNKLLPCMGMEGYVLMTWPNASDVGTAMGKFADKGLKVGINELTVRNYTDDQERHADRYKDVFTQYCEFVKSHPGQLTNVSIWGLFDRPDLLDDTENYDYQIYGTYSGLYTADYKEKLAFGSVLDVLKNNK